MEFDQKSCFRGKDINDLDLFLEKCWQYLSDIIKLCLETIWLMTDSTGVPNSQSITQSISQKSISPRDSMPIFGLPFVSIGSSLLAKHYRKHQNKKKITLPVSRWKEEKEKWLKYLIINLKIINTRKSKFSKMLY